MIPFLLDADKKAKEAGKSAILIISDWGSWKMSDNDFTTEEANLFVTEMLAIIKELLHPVKKITDISHIVFNLEECAYVSPDNGNISGIPYICLKKCDYLVMLMKSLRNSSLKTWIIISWFPHLTLILELMWEMNIG